jgi:PiT family inorganic phosphate transporter
LLEFLAVFVGFIVGRHFSPKLNRRFRIASMEGPKLTDISLFVIVMTTAASITTGLSAIGVPISLVMATVMTIAGLGWGRATRPIALADAVCGSLRGEIGQEIALDALTVDQDPPVAKIGEAEPRKVLEEAGDLFDRQALARYVSMWIVGPSVALGLSPPKRPR